MSSGTDCNSLVSILGVIGTFSAVIVALFGEWIRGNLFRPKLKIELKNEQGEKTYYNDNYKKQKVNVRYYHLNISNQCRWPKAHQVRVFLKSIEVIGNDENLNIIWTGEVPLQWRHQKYYPLERTIGPSIDCDICYINERNQFRFALLFIPNNFPDIKANHFPMMVSVQTKSDETESKIIRIKISWDGEYDTSEKEMAKHFRIQQLK
jgi:hypothetical protein